MTVLQEAYIKFKKAKAHMRTPTCWYVGSYTLRMLLRRAEGTIYGVELRELKLMGLPIIEVARSEWLDLGMDP